MPDPPTDAAVVGALEAGLVARGEPGRVQRLQRRRFPMATSFALDELVADLDDGRRLELVLKDLAWERLIGDAPRIKPGFLHEPRRSIETYASILSPEGIGPVCYAAVVADGRHWLLLQRVPGVELWQIGELDTWSEVARWVARFHLRFAGRAREARRRSPHLLEYGPALLRLWPRRAVAFATRGSVNPAARPVLEDIARRYGDVVEKLGAVTGSFIHGELFPSNVLITGTGRDASVWPIDWEMAGIGPPLLDLAALVAGWEPNARAALVAAYRDELANDWGLTSAEFHDVLACCRLHYALQWLGWAPGWAPPAEHARDWLAETVAVAGELGLIETESGPSRPASR